MSCPFTKFTCVYLNDDAENCETTGEKCIENQCDCYNNCVCCTEYKPNGGICEIEENNQN